MVLVLLGVLLVSLTGAGWLTLRDQKQDIVEQTRSRGEDLSRFLSQGLTFSAVGYDYHSIQWLLEEIVQSQDIAFASVRSDRDNVMASAGAAVAPSVVPGRWITFDRDIVFDGKKVGASTLGLDNARIVATGRAPRCAGAARSRPHSADRLGRVSGLILCHRPSCIRNGRDAF